MRISWRNVLVAVASVSAVDYNEHGDNWNSGICLTDKHQSPIDLPAFPTTAQCTAGLEFNISAGSFELNTHYSPLGIMASGDRLGVSFTVRANTCASDIMGTEFSVKEDTEYELSGFHFHAESEHTHPVSGKQTRVAGELHLVFVDKVAHKYAAVVGFMLDSTKDRESPFLAALDTPVNATEVSDVKTINWLDTELGDALVYQTYVGSLTVPDCGGPLRWMVAHIPISKKQQEWLDVLKKVAGDGRGNYRKTQPLNNRKLSSLTPVIKKIMSSGTDSIRLTGLGLLLAAFCYF